MTLVTFTKEWKNGGGATCTVVIENGKVTRTPPMLERWKGVAAAEIMRVLPGYGWTIWSIREEEGNEGNPPKPSPG